VWNALSSAVQIKQDGWIPLSDGVNALSSAVQIEQDGWIPLSDGVECFIFRSADKARRMDD
jgi:hypothetical protein